MNKLIKSETCSNEKLTCMVDGRYFVPVLYFRLSSQILAMHLYMSRRVGKPTMWFPNRSDTNQAVQAQEIGRSLKFWI